MTNECSSYKSSISEEFLTWNTYTIHIRWLKECMKQKDHECLCGLKSLYTYRGHFSKFTATLHLNEASLVAQMVRNLLAVQETWVWSLGWEDPLEKGMTTHSSILAWEMPWTEEPEGLQSTGSQRVGHSCVTHFHLHLNGKSHQS